MNPISLLRRRAGTPGQKILRWVMLAVLLNTVAVGVLLLWKEVQGQDKVFSALITKKVEASENRLLGFFRPINACLSITRQWGLDGALDLSQPESLASRFIPFLDHVQQISSLWIASEEDLFFLRRKTGGWNHGVYARPEILDQWDWYREAVDSPSVLHFGSPELLDPEGVTGQMGSVAWTTPEGNVAVAAVSVPLRGLEELSRGLDIGQRGEVFWISDRGFFLLSELLGEDAFDNESPIRTVAKDLLDSQLGSARPEPFSFRIDKEKWWCGVYSTVVEERSVRLGLAMPENELAGQTESQGWGLLYLLFGSLGLGVVALAGLARSFADDAVSGTLDQGLRGQSKQEILERIREGESEHLEFKSTLRWNLHEDRAGKEVEISWLRTVVAFLNTEGGSLFIGVADDGSVVGIEADRFPSEDKFLLHFNNLIREHIGLEFTAQISFEIREIDGGKILVVDCRRSESPVFLKKGKAEEFYVRVGPGNRQLSPSKVLDYVRQRT